VFAPRGGGEFRSAPSTPRFATTPKDSGSSDFEHMMKQFIQNSDNKLSGLKINEKKSTRRTGHK
jgi:hypothetical protein